MPRTGLLILVLSATVLSACVVAPYPRAAGYAGPAPYPGAYAGAYATGPAGGYSGAAPFESGVVVDIPPPAPYAEVVPAIPFAGALWIGGYWGWHGGRHQWSPGRWEQPRPGYAWRPYAWAQQGGRWQLHAGGWVRH